MDIQNGIKMVMKAKGITQTDLAERIGKGQSSIAMYLKSNYGMQVETLMKLLDACGYDLVFVDKSNPQSRIVIGENGGAEIAEEDPDEKMQELIRRIVNEELEKRTGTPGSMVLTGSEKVLL